MNVEVPGDGSGEAEFTIVDPDFTGDIEINLEDIPLQYEPKTVSVDEDVDKKVVVTLYGDESTGSINFTGKITFLPVSEAMFAPGIKVTTLIIHRVTGVPVDPTPTPPEYFLSVSTEPEGSGSVTADPPQGPYASGTEVALTAVPAAGYVFDHWSGNASGSDPEVTITMDSHKNVTARFVPQSALAYFLNVGIEPEGSGSVTVDPPEGPYAPGTEVALTAEPAAGYVFDHWSGDASGSDPEVTVTMDSHKMVTAHFSPAEEDDGTSDGPGKAEDDGVPGWVYVSIGVLGGAVVVLIIGLLPITRRRRRSR